MSLLPRAEYALFRYLVLSAPLSYSPLKPAVPAEKKKHISLFQLVKTKSFY